jgi:hypothetical protein
MKAIRKYLELPHQEKIVGVNTLQTKPFDNQKTENMSNNKQQTAMEILFDRIKIKGDSISMNTEKNRMVKGAYVDCLMLIKEAKEMEKEQMIDFANDLLAQNDPTYIASPNLAENYYNETYGGNK